MPLGAVTSTVMSVSLEVLRLTFALMSAGAMTTEEDPPLNAANAVTVTSVVPAGTTAS